MILQLDQAPCHRAKRLQVPPNIILMFQLPYAPETNPIEQVWQSLKRGLQWALPQTLDELRRLIQEQLQVMTQPVIAAIVDRASIREALSVVGI